MRAQGIRAGRQREQPRYELLFQGCKVFSPAWNGHGTCSRSPAHGVGMPTAATHVPKEAGRRASRYHARATRWRWTKGSRGGGDAWVAGPWFSGRRLFQTSAMRTPWSSSGWAESCEIYPCRPPERRLDQCRLSMWSWGFSGPGSRQGPRVFHRYVYRLHMLTHAPTATSAKSGSFWRSGCSGRGHRRSWGDVGIDKPAPVVRCTAEILVGSLLLPPARRAGHKGVASGRNPISFTGDRTRGWPGRVPLSPSLTRAVPSGVATDVTHDVGR